MGSRTKRRCLLALAGGAAVAGVTLVGRYRRELAAAWARLEAVDRRVVATPFGDVEYAEVGNGEPLLLIHGLFHGCDGGLLSTDGLPRDRRVIAPSRFGYLGSSLPPGATPATQADAFADLLDALGIDRTDVVGISAGTTSALQFALRHPDRVGHLVVISGNLPGNPTATAPPSWARLLYADVPMWVMKTFARRAYLALMGVPRTLPLDGDAAMFMDQMADSIFPMAPRAAGGTFDTYVSNPDVNNYRLEDITAPTLLVHAEDDPLTSYEAAQQAARRIPHARLVSIPAGGHLLLGQDDVVRQAIAAFLVEPVTTTAGRTKGDGEGNHADPDIRSLSS